MTWVDLQSLETAGPLTVIGFVIFLLLRNGLWKVVLRSDSDKESDSSVLHKRIDTLKVDTSKRFDGIEADHKEIITRLREMGETVAVLEDRSRK